MLVVKLQNISYKSAVSLSQTGFARKGSKDKHGPVQS